MRKFVSRYASVAIVFVVSGVFGALLIATGTFEREELQLINNRFEWRYLVSWTRESFARLNPTVIWDYHQKHEMPRQWYAWDYTLSWLLQDNHPAPKAKIAIFNHLQEDEPPPEAVADHAWMLPLMRTPMPRAAVADMVRTLARAGAKSIILDNDFPQYTEDDPVLAKAIHDTATGKVSGHPVPVWMVRSVYRQSSQHVAMAQTITKPSGVLDALQQLEPNENVIAKYTGTACLYSDKDQVVRRALLHVPSLEDGDSVMVKAANASSHVPDLMDINFISPPNSDTFKVRPLTYLLDPELKSKLGVENSVVIIGDGIVDLFDTPYTNSGLNRMSGSEVLAHAINTIEARNWLTRPGQWQQWLAVLAAALTTSIAFWISRHVMTREDKKGIWKRVGMDALIVAGMMLGWTCLSAIVFASARYVLPIVVPEVSIGIGFLAAIIFEREQHRAESVRRKLEAAELRHQSEMMLQESESKLREIMNDRQRRREFIRRINHDLKAPLTVLNWNLSKLCNDGITAKGAEEKVQRLVKTSDRLYELIAELTKTYDDSKQIERQETVSDVCKLQPVLSSCVALCQCLAEMNGSTVTLEEVDPESVAIFAGEQLSRVIENLVKNAIVHNPSGTAISIGVETNDKHHIIKIKDNGKGIPPEHLDKIFDSEYRVNPADGKGTGLGLAIVKSLVEETGGQVSVASKVGVGTTFLVAVRCQSQLVIDRPEDMLCAC